MKLRKLELKDAQLMLAEMQNVSMTTNPHPDFVSRDLFGCERFIKSSWKDNKNIHFAIASDSDEYMGIVSLKNIEDSSAELAITVRTEAMGRGYSWFGIEAIIEMAFKEIGIECIYWCVSKDNSRAVRFFEKHNFNEIIDIPQELLIRYEGIDNLKWYSVLKGETFNERETVAGCKVVHINTIPTVNAGQLSFFEGMHEISFEIKRIYYISKVPEGVRRGFHAHKELKQIIFCPYGRIQLILENKKGREEMELSDPSIGVVIDEPTWREMVWLQKDSVLCVAASDYYKVEDYIRDYSEFIEYITTTCDMK